MGTAGGRKDGKADTHWEDLPGIEILTRRATHTGRPPRLVTRPNGSRMLPLAPEDFERQATFRCEYGGSRLCLGERQGAHRSLQPPILAAQAVRATWAAHGAARS